MIRVPTDQGKLEKAREFEWSGKVRKNAKSDWKVRVLLGKFFTFSTVVLLLIIVVRLESNPAYC